MVALLKVKFNLDGYVAIISLLLASFTYSYHVVFELKASKANTHSLFVLDFTCSNAKNQFR